MAVPFFSLVLARGSLARVNPTPGSFAVFSFRAVISFRCGPPEGAGSYAARSALPRVVFVGEVQSRSGEWLKPVIEKRGGIENSHNILPQAWLKGDIFWAHQQRVKCGTTSTESIAVSMETCVLHRTSRLVLRFQYVNVIRQ